MTDSRDDDFDRGARHRRAALGDEFVERSLGHANRLTADFQSLVTRHAWNDVWSRPGLERTTRRLLVLAMTMAQARWEEFELHCRAALRSGVTPAVLQEALLQGAVYCGLPAANTAFKITARVCTEEGIELAAAPLTPGARVQLHHTFSVPQIRVALQGVDQGVPVVLSHALGMDLTMWDALAAHLAPRHPVLRFDHPGQGGSALPGAPLTLDALLEAALRVIGEWGRGPVVFIGLSMGGVVAQGLAIRHPQALRGLVLASTAAVYGQVARDSLDQRAAAVRAGGMAVIVDATLERFISADTRAANPALAAAVRAQLLRADPAGFAASCAAIRDADWSAQLGAVGCPTLVISGGRDPGSTPAMGRAIADAIAGARHCVLEAAAHLSVLEQPQSFAAEVDALLATLG